jgi:hypothetical protein
VRGHETEAIAWLHAVQDAHWARIGYTPTVAPGQPAGVSASDIEHALCEVFKWFRKAMPWLAGGKSKVAGYTPSRVPLAPAVLPRKWTDGSRRALRAKEAHHAAEADGGWEIEAVVAQHSAGACVVRWATFDAWFDSTVPVAELEESAPEVLAAWRARRDMINRKIAAVQRIKVVTQAAAKAKKERATLRRRS